MPEPAAAVFVVKATPSPPEGVLLAESFRAAAEHFGVGAIDDVAGGPALTAVLLLGGAVRTEDDSGCTVLSASLEDAIRRGLLGRGHGTSSVVVRYLDAPLGELEVLHEAIDHWVQELREQTTVTAERRAFRQVITDLLLGERIRTLFQPIADLASGETIGFEALSRGPARHYLEAAETLLDAARRSGAEGEAHAAMMRLARRRAQSALPRGAHLLFVNAGPQPSWVEPGAMNLDEDDEGSWPWVRTVVEISEQAPIEDVPGFLRVRDMARERGVRFALDDVGAGYAGLATLAIVNPDFLKIDMGLIRDCDRDPWRQAIIDALLHLGERTGATIVAEGVETGAELDTLRQLGVPLVQGFLLGMPSSPPAEGRVDRTGVAAPLRLGRSPHEQSGRRGRR